MIRSFSLLDPAHLGNTSGTSNPGIPVDVGILFGTSTKPVIDEHGLRFDIPTRSGSNAAGSWFCNFSQDLTRQWDEGSEFYVYWEQRFNRAMCETMFVLSDGSPGGGIKQIDISTQDRPGKRFNSCETLEIVATTYKQHRFPILYNACGYYEPMYELFGAYDFKLQNQSPSCMYHDPVAKANNALVPAGCMGWVPDEFMRFQIGVTVGQRGVDANGAQRFLNSRVRMWVGRPGQPQRPVLDWKPGIPGYWPLRAAAGESYGKVWLLPYMTSKWAGQDHPLCQTWYRNLIISESFVEDDMATPTPQELVASGEAHLNKLYENAGQPSLVAQLAAKDAQIATLTTERNAAQADLVTANNRIAAKNAALDSVIAADTAADAAEATALANARNA